MEERLTNNHNVAWYKPWFYLWCAQFFASLYLLGWIVITTLVYFLKGEEEVKRIVPRLMENPERTIYMGLFLYVVYRLIKKIIKLIKYLYKRYSKN